MNIIKPKNIINRKQLSVLGLGSDIADQGKYILSSESPVIVDVVPACDPALLENDTKIFKLGKPKLYYVIKDSQDVLTDVMRHFVG